MSDYARDRIHRLLSQYTSSESLLRHAYAVEAAMRRAARREEADEEYWGAVGLLHDFDYERYPEAPDHPERGAEILREEGFDEAFIRVILSHASYTGVPRDTPCARWLFAVDELCGFCMACAMVQPDKKIASVKVRSVKKKLKQKSFAAKVDRAEIRAGAEDLGLELPEVIELVLGALGDVSQRLGL